MICGEWKMLSENLNQRIVKIERCEQSDGHEWPKMHGEIKKLMNRNKDKNAKKKIERKNKEKNQIKMKNKK